MTATYNQNLNDSYMKEVINLTPGILSITLCVWLYPAPKS